MTMTEENVLTYVQIIYYAIIVILLIATVYPIKTYFYPKCKTGLTLKELHLPKNIFIRDILFSIAALGIAINLLFKYSMPNLSYIVIIALIFRNILFCFLPEKICENGILTRHGFISWEMIKKIESIDGTENSIELILTKQRLNGTNKYILYSSSSISDAKNEIKRHLKNTWSHWKCSNLLTKRLKNKFKLWI